MLDVDALEAQWKRYRRKKQMPLFALIGMFSFLTVIVSYYLFFAQNLPTQRLANIQPKPPSPQISKKQEPTEAKHPLETKPPQAKNISPKKVADPHGLQLNADVSFMEKIGSQAATNIESKKRAVRLPQKPTMPKKQHTEKTEEKPAQTLKISIASTSGNDTLNRIIKKFSQTNDPKLAVYIANSFYRKGEYQETLKWSKIANQLDHYNEDSWILFAKAKNKLGHKRDAVNVLKAYLEHTPSSRIKQQLNALGGY